MSLALLVFLQGAAIATSLFGFLLVSPGFFASIPSRDVGAGGGLALLTIAAAYGWWPVPLVAAATGIRGAYLALVVLDLAWVVLAQGLAGLALCALPFCPDLAPWSDLARYASLVVGLAAAWAAWRGYRSLGGPTQWAPLATAVVLTAVSFTVQGLNAPPL